MSYGSGYQDLHERGGMYVGKIPNGAKPADLPIRQSTKVETGDQYKDSESARSHYLHRMKIEEQDRELLAATELPGVGRFPLPQMRSRTKDYQTLIQPPRRGNVALSI